MRLIARAYAHFFERAQKVMDESEAEDDGGEKTDDRHVGRQAEQQAKHVERPAAVAENATHLLRIGMLGERVVAQKPLVYPCEHDKRDDRPQRREQPERHAKQEEKNEAKKSHQAVPSPARGAPPPPAPEGRGRPGGPLP